MSRRSFLVCGAACAALACSRDLTLPTAAQPPQVEAVTPDKAFAGSVVTVTGRNLDDPGLQVSFGLRPATVVTPPDERDGKSVQVIVPEDVLDGTVAVGTPQGSDEKEKLFTYLGLGHPRALALRSVIPVGPEVRTAAPLGDGTLFALLDVRYGSLVPMDTFGNSYPPIAAGTRPILAFGSQGNPWVLDATKPALRHVDIAAGAEVAADQIAIPTREDRFVRGAAGSPGALRFAMPTGAASIDVWALTTPGFPKSTLPIAGATKPVLGVRFLDDFTGVGLTEDQVFRVTLGAAVSQSISAPIADANARPDRSGPLVAAVSGAGRIAYKRADGRIGFATTSGTPAIEPDKLEPIVQVGALSFSDGDATLLVLGPQGNLLAFDVSTPSFSLAAAQVVPGLASLSPIRAGPMKGRMLGAISDPGGSVLLFPNGTPIRTDVVPVFDTLVGNDPLQPDAMKKAIAVVPFGDVLRTSSTASDPLLGKLIVTSRFGPLLIDSLTFAIEPTNVNLKFDGIASGQGGVVAWTGTNLYAPTALKGWARITQTGFTIVDAALSPDGKWAAVSGLSDGLKSRLTLVPLPGNGTDAPAVVSTFSGNAPVPARYLGPTLIAGHDTPSGYSVSAYAPGTLNEIARIDLPAKPIGVRVTPSFGGVLIDVPNFVNGTIDSVTATLWSPDRGVLGSGTVRAELGRPASLSADGRLLLAISPDPYGRSPGLDSVLLQVIRSRLAINPQPHIDLPGRPAQIVPSPDGGRLYVLLPEKNAIAVIE